MKQKTTLMAFVWLLLMYSHQLLGSPGEHHLSKLEKNAKVMLAPPAAGFTYVANSGCVPVTVQFYSQLNGPAYAWTFGDGGLSSDCNPVHTYTTPGVYTVTLVATGGTYSTTITVGANPVVTFVGDTISCQNDSKSYSVTSSVPAASYSWSAQGGSVTSSTSSTANVTWSSYGVNYLNYTITTAAGCTKVFRYKVKVIPPPSVNLPCCKRSNGEQLREGQAPIIDDRGDPKEGVPGGGEPCSACAGSYNCYDASISQEFGTSADYIWTWTVTNGTIASISSDSTEACVVWGTSGTGTIKLEITHKIYGCKSVKECEVTITPGTTPAFSVSGSCINTPVNFDASATTPIANVVSYFWEFGDGYTATTSAPFTTHQFTFVGTYTATLTITTKEGCQYKTKVTFNIISGTKPTIECPGTACGGSRQCYSTELIPGAVYTWTITGDVLADRVITQNKVCVTWGNGPVGTITVSVAGGGYTCTNTATESISIVGSTIAIDAPDFICTSLGYLKVSTANYAGACYKWTVDGVSQSSTSNVLNIFPSSLGNPITVEVDVDFPLGCCHGKGIKVIKKLPQYTMFPFNYNVCVGSTVTYFLSLPVGAPTPPISWSVDGGTITSFTASSVTITWNTVGTGTITAGNNSPTVYCNDGDNNTWNVNISPPATGDDISGPALVCAGTTSTYYHAWQAPTGSVIVTCPGATVVAGTASSSITFPIVAVPTTYTVSVTYVHSDPSIAPCNTTKTYTVKSIPAVIPVFTIPPGVVCQGDIKTYTATVPDNVNFSWNVIGGSIVSETYVGTTLTINVQWNSTLTSSLTMTNKVCGTSGSQPITVNGKPVVIITTSGPTCSSPTVQLRVAPIWSSYLWSPGGTTPTTSTTNISSPGIHSVTISNGVCSSTGSINVPVVVPVPPVITGFSVTPPTGTFCPKLYLICPNITLGSGSIVSYSWTFSGFTTSSSTSSCASVALPNVPGISTGNWTLTITDSYGCTTSLSSSLSGNGTCTPVGGGCLTPYAATFNTPTYDPCTGQFNTSGTNYIGVSWDFGDGTTGSGFNPIKSYATACNKNIICYVTDINNCVRAFPFTISVPYTFGIPTITNTDNNCTGVSSITANGVNICPGSGLSATYSWTITPSAGGAPIYVVTTTSNVLNVGTIGAIPAGDYNATVTMTIAGCSRTISNSFNKGGLKAYFVSCGGCAGSPLTFTDQSVPYTAAIIKWNWVITGPAGFTSSLQNPTINFTVPGTYTVSLTVTDNNPCTATYSTTIVIQPPFVPGNILVNGVSTPSNTTFDICPTSSYILTAPAGIGYTYSWSNGSTASTLAVTEPGSYFVTVFNSSNCATKVGPININYKPAPEAIILTSASLCDPRLLRAFAGTGYSYLWNYPVSSTSTSSSIYLFTAGLVKLKVTNLYGCMDSVILPFTIQPTPFVNISSSAPFCPGSTVTLTANVSGGTTPYNHLWNNGNTTNAITVSNPGLYKYRVIDANGCTANSQINLQPQLPFGLDLLPYGCYDICNKVTFCAGSTMPFGWTGQWYNGATPFGPAIPSGGSLATTFSASGSYTLHYIPTSPSRCPAISKPININLTSLPVFTINGGISPVLCIGSGIGALLTVDIQSTSYNYTWYYGGAVVGSGYTYTATLAGTYILEISKGECCKTSTSIYVGEANCCFENPNVPFTPILNDTVIASNVFWFNKYYIDATVTVVGDAILDITNVDCVFGPRGTIVFREQSFLRSNNSVLRPCEKDDVWQGLHFYDRSSGWINTTTIKNAIIAVDIQGNDMGVRLTDNSFIKCQVGVNILKSREQQSISGNSFEIDETRLPYPNGSTDYFAIQLYDAQMKGLIAQNRFRNAQPLEQGNRYFGVYVQYANATISENYFNDMHRAIDVTGNRDVVAIEKNDIKINTLTPDYDKYQIRVSDTDIPVLIYENKMDNGLGRDSYASAIYCQKTYRTHIKDNTINGFLNGITSISTKGIHIASNVIKSNTSIGINLNESHESIISCNNINGMKTDGLNRLGIWDVNGYGTSSIFANCIFNMNTSIYLQAASFGYRLPAIYNNYLYNYDVTGLVNIDYVGALGNPGGATDAGRNTFMSNNGAVGTLDINSSPTISEDGNFGVQYTSGTFTNTPPDQFYSTAACGQQISSTYPKNQLDQYNTCDVYYLERWVYKTSNGLYMLRESNTEITASLINQSLDKKETEVLGQVSAQMIKGNNSFTNGAQAILDSKMDKNLAARIIVSNCIAIKNTQMATNYLANSALAGIDSDLRKILEITIALAQKPALTVQQRNTLTSIDNLNNEYSPIARDIVHANGGEYDYKFKKITPPQAETKNTAKVISKLSNNLSIYPIPASQEITVTHNVKDATVKGLKIVTSTGKEITSFKYTVQSGVVTIDISSLASGVYSVIIETDNDSQASMTGRFIKIQ